MYVPTWYTDQRGGVHLNALQRYIKFSFMVPAQGFVPLVVPAAPSATVPTASPPIVTEGNEDAYSMLYSLVGEQDAGINADVTNRFSVNIQDLAYRRILMNRSILANQIFGSAQRPALYPKVTGLEPQQAMVFQFFNNSTLGATSFRFNGELGKIQASVVANPEVSAEIEKMRREMRFLTPYWLTSDIPISLAAAGSAGDTGLFFFTGTKDIMLYLFAIMSNVIVTGGAAIQDNFEFELLDSKNQRPLQTIPVLESIGTGTAQFPYILPWPIQIEPNMKLTMRIRNLNANPIEVFFTFLGVSNYLSVENIYIPKPARAIPTPYVVGAP